MELLRDRYQIQDENLLAALVREQTYLCNEIDPILQPVLRTLLVKKPSNVTFFLQKYFEGVVLEDVAIVQKSVRQ